MASFDPLAGSQIDVDPSLKPKRPTGIQKRRLELIQMFMGQGMDEASAAQAADQYLADYPAATGQSKPTPAPAAPAPMSPQQSMEADLYAQGYSADEARKQAQLQAELRAEREAKQLEQDLSQGGYGQRRVPSPRGIDGRSTQGTPFASVKEAEGYESREALPNGGYAMSQKDKDMRARGMVPVIGPSGNVTYMVESVDGSQAGVLPGAAGRRGDRPDLAGKYETQYVTGLDGEQQAVLRPTAQFREQMVAQNAKIKEAQDNRNPYRDLASPAERMKRFQAQLQLGGGRLSPQAIQVETMLNGMDPEQRQRALQYMAPGGALAAQVDARNLEAAAGIARNAVMGALGQQGQNNPAAQAAAEAQLPVDHQAEIERKRNNGTLPANSPAGKATLKQIENDVIGPISTDAEVDAAIEQAVQAGIPRPEAEAYFLKRRWSRPPARGQGEPLPPAGGNRPM